MCSPSDLTIKSQSLHPHTLWFFSSECSQSAGGISYEFVTHTHPSTCIWKRLTFKLNWEEVLLLTCSYPFLDRNKRKDRSGWEAQGPGRMQVYGVLKTVLEHVNACKVNGNYCHILLSYTLKKNTCFLMGKSSVIWLWQNTGSVQFSSVQSLSYVRLFANPWIAARQASLSITNSQSLLKLMSIESVMPSSYLIFCCPLLLLPPISPSIRVFSSESAVHIRWPKYWSFSFSISPSNEHPGLISFRMDLLDLLAVQGTLKSLLQHHSWKASILLCSAYFIVQLSPPYMTTGKTIALTSLTFVGKVMSLLFQMLSRLVITFLPRSKHLLISWLQSASAVILELKKIKLDSPLFPHLFPMRW